MAIPTSHVGPSYCQNVLEIFPISVDLSRYAHNPTFHMRLIIPQIQHNFSGAINAAGRGIRQEIGCL